ncbi:hypothetical protein M427DRAFT_58113 [Gonapodya prolifera JEL478]|uniref:Uncharacterized protein n=1 Tax=Gonapodya prolifera (strain JEL478) TaxID=1344416 RepID=A0A139AAX5_GONPJ|nr:hypothetical protein M427DRAFT_58113 [Gonapodya prolifera JEL478]|eukprot:KXS13858.1 hypothetical protein M427DRAFT_58113 [Gonapodya prolifera JEL478]
MGIATDTKVLTNGIHHVGSEAHEAQWSATIRLWLDGIRDGMLVHERHCSQSWRLL